MWCARLLLSPPDSTVVVCAGRNWAALGSPFFYLKLSDSFLRRRCVKQPGSIERISFLLSSCRQKECVLRFTSVISAR
jgi:hypothetical protein